MLQQLDLRIALLCQFLECRSSSVSKNVSAMSVPTPFTSGLKLAERGGRNAKKRAIIATARKLAVLLHHLWVSGEVYEPLHNSQPAIAAAA